VDRVVVVGCVEGVKGFARGEVETRGGERGEREGKEGKEGERKAITKHVDERELSKRLLADSGSAAVDDVTSRRRITRKR
jgi:hypothetical protein